MARKKLLIVLGAGSSVECGVPAVDDINRLMRGWAAEDAVARGVEDHFDAIWEALEEHLAQGFQTMRADPDFERALADLAGLMHWVRPAPAGGALRALVGRAELRGALQSPSDRRHAAYIEVKVTLGNLLARLARQMRCASRALDLEGATFTVWRDMLQALRARFDVAIYNLNYDAVAARAWPDAPTGFGRDGAFDAHAFHARPWEGLMHVHGSVHFSLRDAMSDTIVWRDDLAGEFFDCDDRQAIPASDDRDYPPTSLIAGGFKLDQLLREPFSAYQSGLVRDAARADAILVGGYGFGDAHVNSALRNALRYRQERPPVLVLDRGVATDLLQTRWSSLLERALHVGSDFTTAGDSIRLPPAALRSRGVCEHARHHRVAVWHGGFLAAGSVIDSLGGWLDGGPDDLLGKL